MIKTLRALAVFLLVCGLASSAAAAADPGGWKTFRSDEGGFRLDLPGDPQRTESGERTFVGAVANHLFSVHQASEEFTVEYSDLPHLAIVLGGPRTILKKAKEALLKDVQGEALTFRLTADKEDDHAELSYLGRVDKNPGVSGLARFYLHGDRIYVLHYMMSDGHPVRPEQATRFFQSFHIDQ